MALLVLGALIVQALLIVVGAAAPVRETPLTQGAFGVSLGENPAFWFRVGVGLLFPLVLAWLAWKAADDPRNDVRYRPALHRRRGGPRGRGARARPALRHGRSRLADPRSPSSRHATRERSRSAAAANPASCRGVLQ